MALLEKPVSKGAVTTEAVLENLKAFDKNFLVTYHEIAEDLVNIAVFLGNGPKSPRMIGALKSLEEEIAAALLESKGSFTPEELGYQALGECFKKQERSENFTVPDHPPIFNGFATWAQFQAYLLARTQWDDTGAGPRHGRYTHRLQWYLVSKAGICASKCGDLFRALGTFPLRHTDEETFQQTISMTKTERGTPDYDLIETQYSVTVWDILCDRIEDKFLADSKEPDDFRHPGMLHTWLVEHGATIGCEKLAAILASYHQKDFLALQLSEEKLFERYAWIVYKKRPDQLDEKFRNGFRAVYQSVFEKKTQAILPPFSEKGPIALAKPQDQACYITTAVCQARDLPDDCFELETLRAFRARMLERGLLLPSEVAEYRRTAPRIVAKIDAGRDPRTAYRCIYRRHLAPALADIARGADLDALHRYRRMVRHLTRHFLLRHHLDSISEEASKLGLTEVAPHTPPRRATTPVCHIAHQRAGRSGQHARLT